MAIVKAIKPDHRFNYHNSLLNYPNQDGWSLRSSGLRPIGFHRRHHPYDLLLSAVENQATERGEGSDRIWWLRSISSNQIELINLIKHT